MTFKTARDNKLLWNCRIAGMRKRFHLIDELGDAVVMNLDHSSGAECVISIPSGLHVFVEGGNGRVNIDKPRFHMDLHLANAKVGVSPADGQAYKYDVKVTTGKTEHFESAAGDRVFNLNIAVDNGAVSRY